MKPVGVLILVLVVCSDSTYSAPAPTFVVDWEAVEAKLVTIMNVSFVAMDCIKTIAYDDDPPYGASLSTKVDASNYEALLIIAQIAQEIAYQTLTKDMLQELTTQLYNVRRSLFDDLLENELTHLSPEASKQIVDIFYAMWQRNASERQEMYALLEAGVEERVFIPAAKYLKNERRDLGNP